MPVRAGNWRRLICVVTAALAPHSAAHAQEIVVLDPVAALEETWVHRGFGSKTEYSRVEIGGVRAIRAVGRNSASALHREVQLRPFDFPWLEWSWRVDRLQDSADLRDKRREDFAAAIFLIFGRPGPLRRDVPTLSYVWTSDKLQAGNIIVSPHHAGTSRSIVLQAGKAKLGQWVRERRNLLEDYRRAFGADPPPAVEVVALWTDNDQTGEPVEAYYGRIAAFPEAP
jgi:hypothetical protein